MKLVEETIARTVESEKVQQVPITCPENLLFHQKGFNYYAIDLRDSDFSTIEEIISGCEAVESDSWKAQEDFFDFITKSDILVYAEKNEQIVGFNLVSLLLINEYCFYTIDEAMVLRAFQGNNIARNVATAALWWFLKLVNLDGDIKKIAVVSISANPKVVNNYFKNKYITRIMDNSFYPSKDLITIHRAYLLKKKLELIDHRFPFCVKNLFPGSQRCNWRDKKYHFLDAVKKLMPSEFDHIGRGDAFAFMAVVRKEVSYFFIRAMVLSFFGMKALLHKKLGLLRNKKNLKTRSPLARIRLIDGRFIDKRINDRRKAERRMHNAGCDAQAIDRRVGDRRISERRIDP